MRLTEICIRRPVLAWMIMTAVILAGLVTVQRIGISQFPNVEVPTIGVSLTWEGAAPEVMETDVVDVIEEALIQVEGVRSVRSSSRLGTASITLEMDVGRNLDAAFQEVQAKINQVQNRLPRDLDPVSISKTNLDDVPIMFVALSGTVSPAALSDYARYQLRERLQTVPGVGEIMINGYRERNVRVWFDTAKLDARGLTVSEVVSALKRQHLELPAGQLIDATREVNVRVLGEAIQLDSLGRLVIAERSGKPIRLSDVALIEDGFEDTRSLARLDGKPALGLGVRKQRGTNAVTVADGVRKLVAELQTSLPPGMSVVINYDSTIFIRDSVNELIFEILQAIVLTGILCWLFLGSLSSTLNVILAIPMSLMGTAAVLYFCGWTLNTFTLLGLGLAVGIVVDDAIMVLENITRHREEGESKVEAARRGTREIAFAALAATVSVVAVFSPVLFMGGLIGKFFLQFGIALSVAILLSYLEAVTLTPARCAQLLVVDDQRRTFIGRLADRLFAWCERVYARVLGISLRRPWLTLISTALIFAASIWIPVHFKLLKTELVPPQDQSFFMVRGTTPVGSSLDETDRMARQAEARLRGIPEIERVLCLVGRGFTPTINSVMMMVVLKPMDQRVRRQDQVMEQVRQALAPLPGLDSKVQDMSARAFTANRGFPIEYGLRGTDWNLMLQTSEKIRDRMQASGLFADVDTDAKLGQPELHISPDRERCDDVGVSAEDVATAINTLVGGVRVGRFTDGGRRLWIRVRLLAEQRSRAEDLSHVRLRSRSGTLVPLSELVTVVERPAQQVIYRTDRERSLGIFANIAPGKSQADCSAWMAETSSQLSAGMSLAPTGASATFKDAGRDFIFAFIGGLVAAYMILAAQFNSFLHPITVLSVLPLSITGALMALAVTGESLNIFSVIGLLLLMGIAKKNSIILVDYTNQLREKHGLTDAMSALLRAGPVRLRPILMTSLATMMAAVPLAIGAGPGGETRRPMAIGIIGGVVVSTLLSLVVVPAFYLVTDRMKQWRIRAKSPLE